MAEMEKAISDATNLGKNSKSIYNSLYRRFMKMSSGIKIMAMNEDKILDILDDDEIPPKSQEGLCTVTIMVRRANQGSYDKLLRWRETTIKKRRENYKMKQNELLADTLPDKDVLESYMNNLFNEKDYTGYIINYLLITFGVRNLDLNVILTADNEVIKSNHKSNMNYLYVASKYVRYIRNNYKTADVYGKQRHMIERRRFQSACFALLDGNYDAPLLKLPSGEAVSEDSVGKIIQRKTFKELGEGKYYKINILDAKKNGNIKRIKELAKSRPHSVETLFKEYDIQDK